mgnify:CR=1 FL=1
MNKETLTKQKPVKIRVIGNDAKIIQDTATLRNISKDRIGRMAIAAGLPLILPKLTVQLPPEQSNITQ